MFVHSGGIEPSSARVIEKKKLMISNDGIQSTGYKILEQWHHSLIVACFFQSALGVGLGTP
jgi:hypothetical protein